MLETKNRVAVPIKELSCEQNSCSFIEAGVTQDLCRQTMHIKFRHSLVYFALNVAPHCLDEMMCSRFSVT